MEIDYYTNLLVNISYTSHVSFLNISFVRSTRVVVNLYYIFFIIYAQGLEVKNISYNNLSKKLRICVFAFLRSYHARHVSTCRAFPPPLSPFLIWHIEIAARGVILFSKLVTIRHFAWGTWSIYFIILI